MYAEPIFRLLLALTFSLFFHALSAQTAKVDSLRAELEAHLKEDTVRVLRYLETAKEVWKYNPQQAYQIADTTLMLAQKLEYSRGIAGALALKGNISFETGDYEKAIIYGERVIALWKEEGDTYQYAGSHVNLGIIYLKLGKLDLSEDYHLKAKALFEEHFPESEFMGVCLMNLGVIHSHYGKYDAAIEYFIESLKLREKLGDLAGQSSSLASLGSTFGNLKQLDRALKYYHQNVAIEKQLGRKRGLAFGMMALGRIYQELGRLDSALTYYEQCLELHQALNDRSREAYTLGLLGSLYLKVVFKKGTGRQIPGAFSPKL